MPEPRRRPAPLSATVLSSERLSGSMVRLVVGGPGLRRFEASPHADSYVKVVFVPAHVPRPLPRNAEDRVDLEAVRATLPPEQSPRMRSYTVRGFDADAMELTLDFIVHGDEGIAGPWAASTAPGDEILLVGPGGSYSPDPTAEHHLLVGDTSALPAIAVALERLPATAQGHALIEVRGPEDEVPLRAVAGIEVVWLHQGDAAPGSRLVEAVRDLPWPDGGVQAFVHGEAGAVKELRRYLRVERGVPVDRLSISGYWRLGVDDEGWRAVKKDWNRSIEESETATLAGSHAD